MLEELQRRAEERRAARRVSSADLFDETAGYQRGDGAVRVDPTHALDTGAGDGLLVRDDRQRFQRRAGETLPALEAEEALDDGTGLGSGDELDQVAITL